MATTPPTDATTEHLMRPIANPLIEAHVPLPVEMVREGNRLLWRKHGYRPNDRWHGFVEGGSAENALWEFQRLSRASDEEIEAFARRYGVLCILPNGRPGTDARIQAGMGSLPPFEVRDGVEWYVEDIRAWRALAEGMRATIAFALALHESKAIDPEEVIREHDLIDKWEKFGFTSIKEYRPYLDPWTLMMNPANIAYSLKEVGPDHMRARIAQYISMYWIPAAGLAAILLWEEGRPYMHLSLGGAGYHLLPENSLFSILVAQMTAVVISAGMERVARCAICGEMFEPMVKPGRHERSFCPRHKLDGKRERKREWARRKAAERRATAETS